MWTLILVLLPSIARCAPPFSQELKNCDDSGPRVSELSLNSALSTFLCYTEEEIGAMEEVEKKRKLAQKIAPLFRYEHSYEDLVEKLIKMPLDYLVKTVNIVMNSRDVETDLKTIEEYDFINELLDTNVDSDLDNPHLLSLLNSDMEDLGRNGRFALLHNFFKWVKFESDCVNGMGATHLGIGGRIVEVRCDDWIVIQRRGQHNNPQEYFFKTFSEYENGFGSVDKELWIGLKNIADLTKEGQWQLRVDLTDWDDKPYFALYGSFAVGSGPRYQLAVSSYDDVNSTLGDSLGYSAGGSQYIHNEMPFSTKDKDQDQKAGGNCAVSYKGGWWYNDCFESNLNGFNFPQQEADYKGIVWWQGKTRGDVNKTWRESTMKIRKIKV